MTEVNRRSVTAAVAAGIGYLVGPTVVVGPPLGLFLLPVSRHFGLSRSGLVLIMCMVASLVGITSPLAGRAIDRFGVRRVVLPAALLFGLGEIALGLSGGSLLAYIGAYAFVGVIAGVQNPIAYSKVVSTWFSRRRGVVLALVGAIGGGGGGVLVPQYADALIRRGGWQLGYIGLGAFIIIVGLPILWLFLTEPRAIAAPDIARASASLPGITRRQAIRTRPFWMVLIAVSLAAGSVNAVSVHLPSLLAAHHPGSRLPAVFLSCFAFGSVVSQFLTGACLDRFNSPKVGAPFIAVAFVGAVLLWRYSSVSDLALAGGTMTGAGLGAELGLACYYMSRFCGLRAYGEIYGAVYGATVACSALGPLLVGLSFDRLGSYDVALGAICVVMFVCVVLILLLPPYRFTPERGQALLQTAAAM